MSDFTQGCVFSCIFQLRVRMTSESGSAHLPWVKSIYLAVETWMRCWIWLIQEQNRKSHTCGKWHNAKLDMFLDQQSLLVLVQHSYWSICQSVHLSVCLSSQMLGLSLGLVLGFNNILIICI